MTMPVNKSQWFNDEPVAMTDGGEDVADEKNEFEFSIEFMAAKMRSHDNPLIDPTWNSSDDTIDVPAVTEELFAGEIDTVADKYDMPRDELAKVVASDLGFWIPTEQSYVDDNVAIVLGTHKELSVPDAYRDAVQQVHNRAAVRITADSDWNVAEQREVYVAPRELGGC